MTHSLPFKAMATLVALATLPVLAIGITAPMSLHYQAAFGMLSILVMLIFSRWLERSKGLSIFLLLLSALVSSRYLYWRATETLEFDDLLSAVCGYLLFAAEIYAWGILILSYLQTIWPLERRSTPLPSNLDEWPTVDIYVPSYNESLDMVRDTLLAAQGIDYPPEKMRIYLLDDGRREEFRRFAEEAGVGYVTRTDNAHAKAGNLNHALGYTSGELITVFDADHVPTRGFLQATVGGFLEDSKLALVQTPHFFYSPDPFERNLSVGEEIPREGEMFYGPVQKGNDFWNATFFCGSCAVIRRSALEEIKGFAVETVTEDAHTALRLQRNGWNTRYLALPLAAGLATERLSLHIGQRMRWARGMSQILRLDNPLLGRGLQPMQRLCYLSAMLHFQFGLPRVIFLLAPLAYLLLGANVIASSAAMILVYAFPHLFHSVYLNSRINGRVRYSFWAEIYETVLAFSLIRPTLLTLISPKRGSFNVTDKGGILPEGLFDAKAVLPHLISIVLLFVGLFSGVIRLVWNDYFEIERGVMLLNIFWAGFSLIALFAAVAVARETRQRRSSVRVPVKIPVALIYPDGERSEAMTRNLSMGGAMVDIPLEQRRVGQPVQIELIGDGFRLRLDVEQRGANQRMLRFSFLSMGVDQRRLLVRTVMGRADAWLSEHQVAPDRPMRSLWDVIRAIYGLFSRSWQNKENLANGERFSRWGGRLLLVVFLLALSFVVTRTVFAQPLPSPGFDAEGNLQVVSPEQQPTTADAQQVEALRFDELSDGGLTLYGNQAIAGLDFPIRADRLVTTAQLRLSVRHSRTLYSTEGGLEVMLNGVSIGRLPFARTDELFFTAELPMDPTLLASDNVLTFRVLSEHGESCQGTLDDSLWVQVGASSVIETRTRRLPLASDLSVLPLPFFDPAIRTRVLLPVMFGTAPSDDTLRNAALLGSYYGGLSGFRGVRFAVFRDSFPDGDAIVLPEPDGRVAGMQLASVQGPELRMIDNPRNPTYKLLLVLGRTAEEQRIALMRLFDQQRPLRGERQLISADAPVVQGDGTPHWVDTQAPVSLSRLEGGEALRVEGVFPRVINLSFRATPDIFLWPGDRIPLNLDYRFPEGDWIDEQRSTLDVTLNGQYLGSLPMRQRGLMSKVRELLGESLRQERGVIELPPALIYGINRLTLYFNLHPRSSLDPCESGVPNQVISRVLPSSNIDMSQTYTFTELPNLAFFVGAGLPFTRQPGLEHSALILDPSPDDDQLAALLTLMGRIGDATGNLASKVEIGRGEAGLSRFADRDLMVLADSQAQWLPSLLSAGPLELRDDRFSMQPVAWWKHIVWLFDGDFERRPSAAKRALDGAEHQRLLAAFSSPYTPGRSVVLFGVQPGVSLNALVDGLRQQSVASAITDDLALIDGNLNVEAFHVADRYTQGHLPWYMLVRWYFGERPLLLIVAIGIALLACTPLIHSGLKARAARRLGGEKGK